MKQLGFLWDVDGMLVENEQLHRAKLIATCARLGVPLTDEDFLRDHTFPVPDKNGHIKMETMCLHGAGDKNIYYWLMSKRHELAATYSQEQWLAELRAFYIKHANDPDIGVKPREGMFELVQELADRGAVQGIVTNGIKQQLHANLNVLGPLAHYMIFTLDADDVRLSKPNPEGYLKGAERMTQYCIEKVGVNPKDIMLGIGEDSGTGVQAAMNANAERLRQGLSRIFCVQYPLEGEAPAIVPAQFDDIFAYSYSGRNIGALIESFYCKACAEPGAAPQRPGLRGYPLGSYRPAA